MDVHRDARGYPCPVAVRRWQKANVSSGCHTQWHRFMRRRTGWPARRQTATATTALQHNAPPARMAGSPTGCNGHDGVAAVKRRARDSNPQPISRHLISSQTASRSLTLRCLFTGSRFGRPRRLIFPGRNRDSWTITAVGFVPQVPGRSGITRAESIRRNRKRMASDGPPSVRSPVSTQPRGSRPESKATDKT